MELYLVRHGEALPDYLDPSRPLSPQGAKDVGRVAAYLQTKGAKANMFYYSTKLRAQQTACIIQEVLNPQAKLLEKEGLAPSDPCEPVVLKINESSENLFIVSHLPFLPILMNQLLRDTKTYSFRPGSVCMLTRNRADAWEIGWAVSPEEI